MGKKSKKGKIKGGQSKSKNVGSVGARSSSGTTVDSKGESLKNVSVNNPIENKKSPPGEPDTLVNSALNAGKNGSSVTDSVENKKSTPDEPDALVNTALGKNSSSGTDSGDKIIGTLESLVDPSIGVAFDPNKPKEDVIDSEVNGSKAVSENKEPETRATYEPDDDETENSEDRYIRDLIQSVDSGVGNLLAEAHETIEKFNSLNGGNSESATNTDRQNDEAAGVDVGNSAEIVENPDEPAPNAIVDQDVKGFEISETSPQLDASTQIVDLREVATEVSPEKEPEPSATYAGDDESENTEDRYIMDLIQSVDSGVGNLLAEADATIEKFNSTNEADSESATDTDRLNDKAAGVDLSENAEIVEKPYKPVLYIFGTIGGSELKSDNKEEKLELKTALSQVNMDITDPTKKSDESPMKSSEPALLDSNEEPNEKAEHGAHDTEYIANKIDKQKDEKSTTYNPQVNHVFSSFTEPAIQEKAYKQNDCDCGCIIL